MWGARGHLKLYVPPSRIIALAGRTQLTVTRLIVITRAPLRCRGPGVRSRTRKRVSPAAVARRRRRGRHAGPRGWRHSLRRRRDIPCVPGAVSRKGRRLEGERGRGDRGPRRGSGRLRCRRRWVLARIDEGLAEDEKTLGPCLHGVEQRVSPVCFAANAGIMCSTCSSIRD